MADRSIYVIIHNQTAFGLTLASYSYLTNGFYPGFGPWLPEKIAPQSTAEFRVESNGPFPRVRGGVIYHVDHDHGSTAAFYYDVGTFSNDFAREVFFYDALVQCEYLIEGRNDVTATVTLSEPGPGVMVYEHDGYSGRSQFFKAGRYDVGDLNMIGNDVISSFQISPGCSIEFFETAGFQDPINKFENTYVRQTDGHASFHPGNDLTSSLIVTSKDGGQIPPDFGHEVPPGPDVMVGLRGVRLFEHDNYNQGPSLGTGPTGQKLATFFGVGLHNLQRVYETEIQRGFRGSYRQALLAMFYGVGPLQCSSLQVGQGYYVKLFDQPDGQGEHILIDSSLKQMPQNWNDRAVSIEVSKIHVPA
jgi:hypothetical protein